MKRKRTGPATAKEAKASKINEAVGVPALDPQVLHGLCDYLEVVLNLRKTWQIFEDRESHIAKCSDTLPPNADLAWKEVEICGSKLNFHREIEGMGLSSKELSTLVKDMMASEGGTHDISKEIAVYLGRDKYKNPVDRFRWLRINAIWEAGRTEMSDGLREMQSARDMQLYQDARERYDALLPPRNS
ncbi:MAG: hypothetical protein Q9162_001472 [Coniocarpon cinnabarinum]